MSRPGAVGAVRAANRRPRTPRSPPVAADEEVEVDRLGRRVTGDGLDRASQARSAVSLSQRLDRLMKEEEARIQKKRANMELTPVQTPRGGVFGIMNKLFGSKGDSETVLQIAAGTPSIHDFKAAVQSCVTVLHQNEKLKSYEKHKLRITLERLNERRNENRLAEARKAVKNGRRVVDEPPNRQYTESILDDFDLSVLERLSLYATTMYRNPEDLYKSLGVETDDIVIHEVNVDTFERPFVVVLDRTLSAIVISIRGTGNSQTDMMYLNVPIEYHEGQAYGAPAKMADNLMVRLFDLLPELCKRSYNKVYVTGHSLGGAVASMFTMQMYKVASPLAYNLECVAFGGLPCISPKVDSTLWKSHITCIINGDDMMSRMLPENIKELQKYAEKGVDHDLDLDLSSLAKMPTLFGSGIQKLREKAKQARPQSARGRVSTPRSGETPRSMTPRGSSSGLTGVNSESNLIHAPSPISITSGTPRAGTPRQMESLHKFSFVPPGRLVGLIDRRYDIDDVKLDLVMLQDTNLTWTWDLVAMYHDHDIADYSLRLKNFIQQEARRRACSAAGGHSVEVESNDVAAVTNLAETLIETMQPTDSQGSQLEERETLSPTPPPHPKPIRPSPPGVSP